MSAAKSWGFRTIRMYAHTLSSNLASTAFAVVARISSSSFYRLHPSEPFTNLQKKMRKLFYHASQARYTILGNNVRLHPKLSSAVPNLVPLMSIEIFFLIVVRCAMITNFSSPFNRTLLPRFSEGATKYKRIRAYTFRWHIAWYQTWWHKFFSDFSLWMKEEGDLFEINQSILRWKFAKI